MKIRTGFVSNSSTSSFVVEKRLVKLSQIEIIENYQEVAVQLLGNDESDVKGGPWDIVSNGRFIGGSTSMDNFDMHHFLRQIKVPDEAIHFQNAEWAILKLLDGEFEDEDS